MILEKQSNKMDSPLLVQLHPAQYPDAQTQNGQILRLLVQQFFQIVQARLYMGDLP
jgi:hypothetical protein